MRKTFAYWKEQCGGIFAGIVCAVFVFLINSKLPNWKDFIREIPGIGMCIFGFLLTFLGIILQGGSKTVEWMKSRKILFSRFIAFNKRVVILSIIVSVYAYFLGYFNFDCLTGVFKNYPRTLSFFIRLLISAFSLLLVWLLIDILKFTKIFYLLIKKN
jgi:hypothetical protein